MRNTTKILLGVLIAIPASLIVGAMITRNPTPATPTAVAVAAPAAKPAPPTLTSADVRAANVMALAEAVKENMGDPKSFQLVKAFATDNGTVCMKYRGKNKFNATVLEAIGMTAAGKATTWAAACPTGAKLHDMSHVSAMF